MIHDCCFLALLKVNTAKGSLVVPSRAGRFSALTSRTNKAPCGQARAVRLGCRGTCHPLKMLLCSDGCR